MSRPPYRVLIADQVSLACAEVLQREGGIVVEQAAGAPRAEILRRVAEVDALIVRSALKVDGDLIGAAPRLRVIGRAGEGVDNIDLDAATQRGIVVMNTPGGNTISAAEHTMSLLLALARNIPQASASLRGGAWDRKSFVGVQLYEKVLGVIGMGKIGREVAQRARAFGMEVVAHDPFLSEDMAQKLKVAFVPFHDLLARADFITLHVPLTDSTRHVLGEEELRRCKAGVRILNCARGGLVDESALERALREGRVAGAALDVFENEPPAGSPLLSLPNLIGTPHLGASTHEAQEHVAVGIAEQVADFLLRGVARNAVNLIPVDPKTAALISPYQALAEKLGKLHAQLRRGRLKEILVEYQGEVSEYPTSPITSSLLKGYFESFQSGPVNAVNATYLARQSGVRLSETRSAESLDFTNLIGATFVTSEGRTALAGTLFGKNNPRIVRLDNYYFDALPEGEILLVSNDDTPGMLGKISSLLGRCGINIGFLSMGRDKPAGTAVAILNLDSEASPEVLRDLESIRGVLWVKRVRL
jgi:D-3-phosphoglycerate dehydrogenase